MTLPITLVFGYRHLETRQCHPRDILKWLQQWFGRSPQELETAGFWLLIDGKRLELTCIPDSTRTLDDIRAAATDPDGSVWGVRYFNIFPPGFLISPSSSYVWQTECETASDFTNAGAVRGHIGFHACFPLNLQHWLDTEIDHQSCHCKALVKGFGDMVVGEVGWRSSRMRVVQAYITDLVATELFDSLRIRYPSVGFNSIDRFPISGDRAPTIYFSFATRDLNRIGREIERRYRSSESTIDYTF